MKILFLTKSYPIYGGVERWLADLVEGLESLGICCLVGLAKGNRFHRPDNYKGAYPNLDFVELDGTTGTVEGRRRAVARLLHAIRPDIVVPVMLADGLAVAALLKARYGYRILYPVHEICEGIANDLDNFGAWIDRVVFVDELGRRTFGAKIGSSGGKPSLIYCGVPGADDANIARIGSPIQLGYCGRIERTQKRVTDLVDICRVLDRQEIDYRLTIIGGGQSRGELVEGLSEQTNNDRVRILPAVTRDQLYERFYPAIDVLLITSVGETGPLVAFEAMTHARVVITSDFEGRKENGQLIDGNNCLVFPVGDVESAARAVSKLHDEPELALSIAKNARNYACKQRLLSFMVAQWGRLLEEVVTQPISAGGDLILPKAKATSRLRRLGVSGPPAEGLRRAFGYKFHHQSIRAEWPPYTSKVSAK